MNQAKPAVRRPVLRHKILYVLSVVALGALLCVNFGTIYTLILHPDGNHSRLMQLAYLCMVAGLLVLAGQVLLVLKRIIAVIGRDAAEAGELAERLEQLVVMDSLTKTYNRGKFEEVLNRELGNVRRYCLDLSGVMLDVDGFKAINEAQGYAAGDRLLANLAHHLNSLLRDNDYLFRWRGGKFIILAPHTDIDKAAIMAEKLRQRVGHKLFGGTVRMTLSLGVAQALEDDTPETFRQRLQAGLATAKNAGRDRVAVNRAHSTQA
ncbi:MAG: GGDEF domain-containing protein [Pseudodesulfovibrio sp.]|uniref:diguanylate cyclase n=1 Tax=Pseudodesulfovibrio indicus TaxID=1716143 RepID=A0A126QK91_9BACT|nr:GGDEF domain-containing protein [Pseudodesulfovibrio indicus]AMK10401.1 diguanylate cyclase [Pseudodesulfovibrio indicus]TDT89208.1 diguanylate cyclase (GGDEF)-like protein [Pseudodesulfovibrio indicus]